MEATIKITDRQADVLIILLDNSIKYNGFGSAANALFFKDLIEKAFRENPDVPKEELKQESAK